MGQRLATALLTLSAALAFATPPAAAEEGPPPVPRFDRVDHSRPDSHLAISPKVGDAKHIGSVATQLRGARPADTLAAISQWMSRNLRFDENAGRTWRPLDEMLKDRSYGGCADHAAVFGTLARAAGIPTVWVKTMDLDWIEDQRAGREAASNYRGHVFLEVFVDGRWQLLDATAMRLYPRYATSQRILPGSRFAYDKGDDPHDLVLSCRWDLWRRQTDAYFARLDPALLPWGPSQDLLSAWRVWVTGDSPSYRYAAQACSRMGYHVESTFNTAWATHLPRARGHLLVVTCKGRQPVFPAAERAAWLPSGWEAFVAGGPEPKDGFLARRLSDGTSVILVTGQDLTAIQIGVARGLAAVRR